MAVYERRYRGYDGPLTPDFARFLILPRYALRDVFQSRIFTGVYFLCFVYPLLAMLFIYLRHNLPALEAIGMPRLPEVDATFFRLFLWIQGMILGFVVTVAIGPGLISADLRNNGLPLYLSRPLSRAEYILGKITILVAMLSLMTWIPGLLLFLLEGYLEGGGWLLQNARLGVAVVLGSWIWILTLSLVAIALSAWVKWKPLASGLLIGLVLVGNGYAVAVNGLFDTKWGHLVNLNAIIVTIWQAMLGEQKFSLLPLSSACGSLAVLWAISVVLLRWKVRAYEVTRG